MLIRSQFRFLSEKEFKKINADDVESVRQARELNEQRFVEEQTRLSQIFVRQAEEAKADSGKQNETDIAEYNRYLRECNNDFLAALDMFLFNRPDYRAEINDLNRSNPRVWIDYSVTAARAGSESFKRYLKGQESHQRALMVTTDAPGAANLVDTTVSQTIIYRAENIGNVLPLLAKVTVPYGDYEEPYYNKYAMAGYLTETGTVPDFNTQLSDASDGIKKTKWTPRDFAFGLEQSFRSLKKLSPSVLNQVFDFLATALNVGMEYQALSGPGTGQNDAGMILNATSIADAGNPFLTFVNACSSVGSKNARAKAGFGNTRAIGELIKLKVINEAYSDMIEVNDKGVVVAGVQIVAVPETVIPVSSNVTQIVVGDPQHYLIVNTGQLTEFVTDNAKTLNRFTTYHMLREGKPRFADSFAKFNVTVA